MGAMMWILSDLETGGGIRPRYVYAPCILVGMLASLAAAFLVGHSGLFAQLCFTISIMPETGSFSVPFGLVALKNRQDEAAGKVVSTALQMALLNCCITIGQQACTMILSAIESRMPMAEALPVIFVVAAAVYGVASASTLTL